MKNTIIECLTQIQEWRKMYEIMDVKLKFAV